MSYTTSPGLVFASRWVGMAAGMASYLDRWLAAPEERAIPPLRGVVASGVQFFAHVLNGIQPNHPQAGTVRSSPMAGISNLCIALEVLSTFNDKRSISRKAFEETFVAYHRTLVELAEGRFSDEAAPLQTVTELRDFFRALARHGDVSRPLRSLRQR